MSETLLQRISVSPDVMVGKPVVRGTRIPVDLIVRMVAEGISFDDILLDYKRLTRDDIQAALFYAASILAGEDIFPLHLEAA